MASAQFTRGMPNMANPTPSASHVLSVDKDRNMSTTRRDFLRHSAACMAAAASIGPLCRRAAAAPNAKISLGLVTYQWGAEWDLPTLIANCTKAKVLGVELRVDHAHKVGLELSPEQRKEVRKRFADSSVTLVGMGTNQDFHHADQEKVRKSIEKAKEYVKLSHDVGGSGVKVKPNDLPKGVPVEKTTAQIGKALNELGAFAADYGQQIRLEVHGTASRLPVIRQILDVATHKNVTVCWNSNKTDLEDPGLTHNFNLVKDRLGQTAHVFTRPDYPWAELLKLFVQAGYQGWWLIESSTKPADKVAALVEQRQVFLDLLAKAQAG